MFFSKEGPKLTELQRLILPVTTEIGIEGMRCIFNYQSSRAYAFHTPNMGQFYVDKLKKLKKKTPCEATLNVPRVILMKNKLTVILTSWDISGISKLGLKTYQLQAN